MRMRDGGEAWDLPPPSLAGAHQIVNAAVAIATARRLAGFAPTPDALARGLGNAEWPARLQRLRAGSLVDRLPDRWELWLDGGHNPAGGAALAAHAAGWRDRPLDLVVGMMNSKDVRGFLGHLAPFARRAICVTIRGEPNALAAPELVAAATALGIPSEAAPSAAEALTRLARGPGPARVLICGSLYFAGTVLADNEEAG
jgi:dihydrofolate synthase/folylpolyglutamate synthase